MGFVRDSKVALVHLADTTTRNGATKTSLVGYQLFFTVGSARGCHRFCRNVFGTFKLVVPVIAGRQSAHFVNHVHQHLGSVGWQSLASDAVFSQDFFLLGGGFHEGFGVVNISHTLGSANGNGFEVFTTHDRSHARAASGAV